MKLRYLFLALAVLAGHLNLSDTAWSRQWKPTEIEAAQDYLQVTHSISAGEVVIIYWFAPEYFENTADNRQIREMVESYMMVGIVHFSVSDLGEWEFKDPTEVAVDLGNSELLSYIPPHSLPPVVRNITILLRDVLAAGIGRAGQEMEILVYDGKRVSRCTEGVVWINYLQERYEYQTPLPGCE